MTTPAETLAREIADLRRRLNALERSGQLSKTTIPGADGEPVYMVDGIRAGMSAGAQAAEAIQAAASAQAKADGAVESFFGATEPQGAKLGDFWRRPEGDVLQYDGAAWTAVTDPEVREDLNAALDRLADTEGALDGKVSTYFAPLLDAPVAAATGDLWIVSDAGNMLRRWDGRTWVDARDQGIEAAVAQADDAAEAAEAAQDTADAALLSATYSQADAADAARAAQEAASAAATAQAEAASAAGIAEGKGDVLIQAAAPAEAFRKATTLWIDTTSNTNTPKRWSGSAWVAVTDKKAADAATAATAAQKAATAAQGTADSAATAAASAASAAQAAKARADAAHALAGTAEDNAQTALTSAAGAASAAQEAQGTADTAKADAASAAGLAEGKADVLIQATAPATAMRKATTLWIDTTSNANTPKRWNGSAWATVTDKKATDAATAASNAQKAADAAQDAADAVSKNLFSTALPSGTAPYGSTWFRVNSSGQVIGQWQQTATGVGSTWTKRDIRSEVIANLDVGKLTAGTAVISEAVAKKIIAETVEAYTVTGATIQTSASGARVVMDEDGLRAYGTGSAPTVQIDGATGKLTATGEFISENANGAVILAPLTEVGVVGRPGIVFGHESENMESPHMFGVAPGTPTTGGFDEGAVMVSSGRILSADGKEKRRSSFELHPTQGWGIFDTTTTATTVKRGPYINSSEGKITVGGGDLVLAESGAWLAPRYVEFFAPQTGLNSGQVYGPGLPALVSRVGPEFCHWDGNDTIKLTEAGLYTITYTFQCPTGSGIGYDKRVFCSIESAGRTLARTQMGTGDDWTSAAVTFRATAGMRIDFRHYQATGAKQNSNTTGRIMMHAALPY